MITNNIIHRVLWIKYWESVWTGFTIEANNKQYIISAKHIFNWLTWEDKIQIFHENKWKTIWIKAIFHSDPTIDIVILKFEWVNITPTLDIELWLWGAWFWQDCYFLGFPYNMRTLSNVNHGYPLPFIKKGIFSAIWEWTNWLVYVDWHNNRWFSWWPIVFKKWSKWKIWC